MLQIEIFPENVALITRTLPPKDGQPPYNAGMYSVDASSFTINNFGGLELKRFSLKIKPVELDL